MAPASSLSAYPLAAAPLSPERLARPFALGEIAPWAIFALFFLAAIYFVGAEQGATALIKGMAVHEFVHDGRHLLGFPCH